MKRKLFIIATILFGAFSFAPIANAQLVLTTSKNNVSCNGGNNGTANVNPSGEISPYTYLWSNGRTTKSMTGLIAGTYTVTVTSSNAVTATKSVVITQPVSMATSSISTTSTTITLVPAGGTPPYTVVDWYHFTPPYLYFNEPINQPTFTPTGLLPANTYYCWLVDSRGCVKPLGATTQP